MALGIDTTSNSGDFLPIIKYDAKAGRFFRVDRTQNNAGEWESETEEMPVPVRFAVDMAGCEVGWMKFENGVDFQMVPVDQPLPEQPSALHKQGFRLKVTGSEIGLRHWSHSAKCVLGVVDTLHDQWRAEQGNHAGEVPVIECANTQPVTTGSGARKSTNYAPVLQIVGWAPRPAEFDQVIEQPQPAQQPAQPAAQQVPPPAQPATQPANGTQPGVIF